MLKNIYILILSLLLIFANSLLIYSYPSGITGRTKKSGTQGCGSCHSQNASIVSSITGPDTVIAGATVNFTWTVTRTGSTSKAGCDIAVNLELLNVGPSGSYLKLLNGELTQKNGLALSSGSFTCQFSYTAPSSPGIDTLWLTSAVGYSNGWNWGTEKRIIVRTPLGINNNSTPLEYRLNQNYPNPFNPVTNISFELPVRSNVVITIYDISGRKTETLTDKEFSAGKYEVIWDASSYCSGVYFYEIKTDTYADTKKMMLVK